MVPIEVPIHKYFSEPQNYKPVISYYKFISLLVPFGTAVPRRLVLQQDQLLFVMFRNLQVPVLKRLGIKGVPVHSEVGTAHFWTAPHIFAASKLGYADVPGYLKT